VESLDMVNDAALASAAILAICSGIVIYNPLSMFATETQRRGETVFLLESILRA
jgi:hypothetical protein